jgi:hypothetical protein
MKSGYCIILFLIGIRNGLDRQLSYLSTLFLSLSRKYFSMIKIQISPSPLACSHNFIYKCTHSLINESVASQLQRGILSRFRFSFLGPWDRLGSSDYSPSFGVNAKCKLWVSCKIQLSSTQQIDHFGQMNSTNMIIKCLKEKNV